MIVLAVLGIELTQSIPPVAVLADASLPYT
jgi:hypothetical protein